MSQSVIDKNTQLEASSSGTSNGLAGFVDQVISTSRMLGDAFSYANSYTTSSNKVTFNFGQNRTVVYTGTITGGDSYSGTAIATSKVLTVPGVIKEDISGTIYYNWNVNPSTGYLTFSPYGTATVNSYNIQTLASSSSSDFGKVSIGLQGSMLLDSETESLSGSISKLTIGAEKFLSSAVIEGSFNVSGVLTSTVANVNSAISGTLSSYKENYKDGSYIDVTGSLDYDGTTSIDRAMLADETNWSGDDTFDINLPTSLSQSWVISSGDGSDTITASGGNSYLTLAGGSGDDTYIVNNASYTILENFGYGTDTIRSTVTYSLESIDNLENLTLTGTGKIDGTGNALDNIITGNSSANTLNGADGNDTINGGAQNDTLNGGLGINDLRGDAGNDTFIVDYTSFTDGDTGIYNTITDSAGIDRLVATFGEIDPSNGAYGESDTNTYVNVRRTGVNGNDLSVGIRNGTGLDGLYDWWGKTTVQGQYSFGSSYANIIDSFSLSIAGENYSANLALAAGSTQTLLNGTKSADFLMGFGGSSVINGNAGNDYLLGSRFDTPEELTVYNIRSPLTVDGIAVSVTTANVKDLSDLGYIVGDRIFGGAGNDYLNGYLGNDYLDGGAGADLMIGWEGNDTYVVDNLGDTIQEAYTGGSFSDAGGEDLVMATISYTLGDYFENLTLVGKTNINGTGNSLDNIIIGNTGSNILIGGQGSDTLIGGLGKDTLTGGSGSDVFIFNTVPNTKTNLDTITDFNVTDDTIQLENSVLTGLGSATGTLDSSMFRSGAGVTTAGDSSDRIIYNTTSGALFYDADGTGATAAVQIALIGNQANLTAADLVII